MTVQGIIHIIRALQRYLPAHPYPINSKYIIQGGVPLHEHNYQAIRCFIQQKYQLKHTQPSMQD